MKDPTPIASFERSEPAQIVAARLRDTCFQAEVVDTSSDPVRRLGGLHLRSRFQVIVPLAQTERAMSWLREFDAAEQLLATALRCPSCGSLRLHFGHQQTEGFMDSVPDLHFHCQRCQCEWEASPGAQHIVAA